MVLVFVSAVVSCGGTKSAGPKIDNRDIRIGQFWQEVRKYREANKGEESALDNMFLSGRISLQQWLNSNKRNIEGIADFPNILRSTVVGYDDVPITNEEWSAYKEQKRLTSVMDEVKFSMLFEERGMPSPLLHPKDEIINLYLSIKPKPREYLDEDTNRWHSDWDLLVREREAILNALSDPHRDEVFAELSKYETPLAMLFQQIGSKYILAYENASYWNLTRYSLQEQRLIREYYQTASPMWREELRRVAREDGSRLISGFETASNNIRTNLRLLDP